MVHQSLAKAGSCLPIVSEKAEEFVPSPSREFVRRCSHHTQRENGVQGPLRWLGRALAPSVKNCVGVGLSLPATRFGARTLVNLLTVAATVIGGSERDTACDIMTAHYIRVTVTVTMGQ